MKNLVFSTRNIDDLIDDLANRVVHRLSSVQGNKNSADSSEEILNVEETAKFLGLTVATIYRKVSRREMPHVKKGRRLYFNKAELLAYLMEGKRPTRSEIAENALDYLVNKKR